MTAPFDFAPLLAPGTPAPAIKWNGFPKYNFIGGHNDAKHVPVDALIAAATAVQPLLKVPGASRESWVPEFENVARLASLSEAPTAIPDDRWPGRARGSGSGPPDGGRRGSGRGWCAAARRWR